MNFSALTANKFFRYGFAASGIFFITLVFEQFQKEINSTTVALAFLLWILIAATFFGRNPALCREIRKTSEIPIIVLSIKGEEKTKVAALDAGVDDYVTKPFGIDELLARVRAALRRKPSKSEEKPQILEEGDFSIDLAAHKVEVRGQEIHLTPKEFDLLVYLFENRGRVLTHRHILAAVWGGNSIEQPEYLRVFLGNLRKKIEINPSQPQYIQTEPWVGYRFNSA